MSLRRIKGTIVSILNKVANIKGAIVLYRPALFNRAFVKENRSINSDTLYA
jgi:hypothetical protein